MSVEMENLPLHDHVKAHLSKRAAEIYSSAYQLIWLHRTGEIEEKESLAHQVAWDRLKEEYLSQSGKIRIQSRLNQQS
jgi:cation transport regulator